MTSSERIKELFDGYLRRTLSPGEVEELVSLLGQADAEEALSGPMRRVWEELRSRPVEYEVDWDRMYRQVSQAEEELSMLSQRRAPVWGWRAAAAVFLVLAGVAAYWSVAYRRPAAGAGGKAVAGVPANGGTTGAEAEAVTGVDPKDSAGGADVLAWQTADNKRVIHLPDGSIVILNRHSMIRYRGPGAAGAIGRSGTREVTLSGEAYFDIVHRPEQSFLVRTGKIVTRVLGTAFNVRAYSADKSIEVTVDHGKVQVLKDGANVGLLSDEQQVRYDLATEICHTQRVNLSPVMAWKPVEISFDDITMAEAAWRIGQRFKVGFNFVNPALKECRITATFYMEDDLEEIMTVICAVNQSTFSIDGNTVRIDGKGCN